MADEKTTFEIALRDSISPGLRAISRELKALNQLPREGASSGADQIHRFERGTSALGSTARMAYRDLTGVGGWIVGVGKGLVGGLGTIETVKKISEELSNLAKNRVQLSMFSRDTRFASDDIDKMRSAMARMGIAATQADSIIGGVSGKLQELQATKEGSPLFQQLAAMGEGGVSLANELIREKDYTKALQRIGEVFRRQGPEAQTYLVSILGVPASVLENLDKNMRKVKESSDVDPAVAQKFLDNQEALRERFDNEWKIFATHAITDVNRFFEEWDSKAESHILSSFGIQVFDTLNDILKTDLQDAQALYLAYQKLSEALKPDVARQRLSDAARKALGLSTNRIDDAFQALQKDDNKLLDEISKALKRMMGGIGDALIGGAGASTMPGGAGSGYPGDTRTSRGETPASLGGDNAGPVSMPVQEGDTQGPGPSGGRFNQPAGTPEIGAADRETVTLSNGAKFVVNKRTAAQFKGFYEDLIKAGAPVGGIGGVGSRGNPSEHPGGFATDWKQRSRNVVAPDVQKWINENREILKGLEGKWGMSGGENWNNPDTGHFSVETLYGRTHLESLLGTDKARENVDKDQGGDVWKKGGDAIKFSFNNVPPGVKTNADASGAFTQVEVSRKSASEERAPD